jgi:hypothetical protein
MSNIDGLLDTVLRAIEKKGYMNTSWINDKRLQLGHEERIKILRWICNDLDANNLTIAAEAIGVTTNELLVTRRVLQKV